MVEIIDDRRIMGRGEYRGTTERRSQIIAAAFDEFAAGGYESASLRSIANKAGITHPGLLYHFKTKEILLVAVLREHEEEERRQFFKIDAPHTTEELVRRLTEAFAGERGRPQLLRLRMHMATEQLSGNTMAREFMELRYNRIITELVKQVKLLKDGGAIAPTMDDNGTATLIFALYDGLLMHSLSTPSAPVEESFRESLSLILART